MEVWFRSFFFCKWVVCRFQPLLLQGCRFGPENPGETPISIDPIFSTICGGFVSEHVFWGHICNLELFWREIPEHHHTFAVFDPPTMVQFCDPWIKHGARRYVFLGKNDELLWKNYHVSVSHSLKTLGVCNAEVTLSPETALPEILKLTARLFSPENRPKLSQQRKGKHFVFQPFFDLKNAVKFRLKSASRVESAKRSVGKERSIPSNDPLVN